MSASHLQSNRTDPPETPAAPGSVAERPAGARPRETSSIVGVAVRDLSRLSTVALTVAKHGFGPLLMKTPLGKRLLEKAPQGDEALRGAGAPVRFAKLLAAL